VACNEEVCVEAQRLDVPYLNAGLKAFLISQVNGPSRIGFHIEGEMGGFWVPPLKFLYGYRLGSSRGEVKPLSIEVWKWKVVKHFSMGSGVLSLSEVMPVDRGCVALKLEGAESGTYLEFEVKVLPVWFSTRGEDEVSMEVVGDSVHIKERNYPGASVIRSFPSSEPEVKGNRVRYAVKGEGLEVLVCGSARGLGDALSQAQGLEFSEVEGQKAQYVRDLTQWLRVQGTPFDVELEWAKTNLALSLHDQEGIGLGFVAGFPDYPWYFGVDTSLSMRGILWSGMFDEAKSSFQLLYEASKRNGWRVPHEIVTNGRIYNYGDLEETPLLVSNLWDIYEFTGDREFVESHLDGVTNMMFHYFSRDSLLPEGPGVMEDEGRNSGVKVDVASFAYLAYLRLGRLHEIFGDQRLAEESRRRAVEIAKFVEESLWEGSLGLYADRIVNGKREVNWFWTSFTPLLVKLAPLNRARDTISNFMSKMWDNGVKVEGRKGVVMPVVTSLFSLACFNYELNDLGWEVLKSNFSLFSTQSPASYPEIKGGGCFMQLWSAATLIEAFLHGLTGLEVDQEEKEVRLRPRLPKGVEAVRVKGLRVGGDVLDLEVGKEVRVESKRGLFKVGG